MIDATNAADSDAFVDCFTDDAYLEDWGRMFHGRDGAGVLRVTVDGDRIARLVISG